MKKALVFELKITSYLNADGLTEKEIDEASNDPSLMKDFQDYVNSLDGDEIEAKMILPNGKILEITKEVENDT